MGVVGSCLPSAPKNPVLGSGLRVASLSHDPLEIPLRGHEFSMPAKDGFGSHGGGKLVEHLTAEDLGCDGKPAPLVIVEEYSFLSELLPEYLILSE